MPTLTPATTDTQTLIAALEILQKARLAAFNGPHVIYEKLMRAAFSLERQLKERL